jgi:hypothetical protein
LTIRGERSVGELTAANASLSRAISRSVVGNPVNALALISEAFRGAVTNPLAIYVWTWLAGRRLVTVPRQRGAMAVPLGAAVPSESVHNEMKCAIRRRRVRRLAYFWSLPWAATLVLYLVLVWTGAGTATGRPSQWFFTVLFSAPLALLPWARRKEGVEKRVRRPWSHSGRGIAGIMLRAVGQTVFVVGAVGYALALVFTLFGSRAVRVNPDAVGLEAIADSARVLLLKLPTELGVGGTFALLVLWSVLCYGLDRLGQRLMALRLDEAKTRNAGRGAFLYLRSFDEDRLRVRASLHGAGPLGLLLPFRRIGLEELIATELGRIAPVGAADPPEEFFPSVRAGDRDPLSAGTVYPGNVLLSPIGGARVRLGKKWKKRIRAEAYAARAVVIAATPESVNDGFWFELTTAASLPHGRVILVAAPWGRHFERRWGGLLRRRLDIAVLRPNRQGSGTARLSGHGPQSPRRMEGLRLRVPYRLVLRHVPGTRSGLGIRAARIMFARRRPRDRRRQPAKTRGRPEDTFCLERVARGKT